MLFSLEIKHTPFGIYVYQRKYAEDLLTVIGFSNGPIFDTSMELNLKLCRDNDYPLSDTTSYCHMVGSLIYLSMTRPDIAYAVQVVSQFASDPHKNHLSSVHRLLRYIKGTLSRGLFYSSISPVSLRS